MGHRKRMTSSVPSFLIISSDAQHEMTPSIPHRTPEPLIIVRSASLPVPLVEERGETI